MAVLKVKDAAGVWQDITGTGATGPSGGPVPTGGLPGEVIEKVGAADFDVGWVVRPRIAFTGMVATWVSSATVNTMATAVSGNATIDPARTYHIIAGHRCIQDPGTGANAQMRVSIGTVNLAGHDVVACTDPNQLWGAWSQNWIVDGTVFTATTASLAVRLDEMCSIASKTFYHPRLHIIEM